MSQTSKQNPPPPAPPTVIYVSGPQTATDSSWQNQPTMNSTMAGAMIFSSAGMNMAMGLGWSEASLYAWVNHFCYSWFIGVIIGTILAIPLRHFMPKRWIMASAGVLVLIGGILFTSVPQNYDALLAARYLNGIAAGLAFLPFLMHVSEIAVDSYRGRCLATEQYYISFGIAIQMIYASYWTSGINFPVNRLHGIFDIIFGVFTGIFLIWFVESPIDQIRKGDEAAALGCLSRLQRPQGVTAYTRLQLEQLKSYVREQENLSIAESFQQGLVPLIKMLLVRSVMLAFLYSLTLNFTLKYSVLINGDIWAPTVAGACRILAGIIAYVLADSGLGRKLPSTIAAIVIGGLMIGESTFFVNLVDMVNITGLHTAMVMFIVIQAFVGFFTPYTSIYMGEAFPLRVKSYLIACCVIFEQIIQIILIETLRLPLGNGLMAEGIIVVVVGFLMMLIMPETRNTSLTEAQQRFRSLFYLRAH
ncbi:uncharacterized protein LOC106088514 [Stomoxys calcitrans]|uniref:Major facilitator superfamily (MFS) profile domain-containing protein n=1 Tax=Stomoxys calcitrans TaxID=35570 RepID=A0A1I8NYS0_STOCA|nr:uncharacterized protein LOC106088514 [Stomoxys calcitrans]